MIYDFQVNGQNDKIAVNGTALFTSVLYDGERVVFSAYESFQWVAVKSLVVFLVNVTESTFYLGWLVILNGASYFQFSLYDYTLGNLTNYILTGTQHVDYSKYVQTPSTLMPTPQFKPEAKYVNQIYITGPNITLGQDSGVYNGKAVYPLLNLFNVTNSWDEVSLITEDYHYILLYARYEKGNPVQQGYELSLTDYSVRDAVFPIGTWSHQQPANSTTTIQQTTTTHTTTIHRTTITHQTTITHKTTNNHNATTNDEGTHASSKAGN